MYAEFDMTKSVPVDRPQGGVKLYTEQSPDDPGTLSFPNGDAGKSQMYTSQPGTYYSTQGAKTENADTRGKHDVGKGMPKGSPYAPAESNAAAFDEQSGGRITRTMKPSQYEKATKQPRRRK